LSPVGAAVSDAGEPGGGGGAGGKACGDVHVPASQTRSPLQSVSFVHWA
jgi:hypothetical protein